MRNKKETINIQEETTGLNKIVKNRGARKEGMKRKQDNLREDEEKMKNDEKEQLLLHTTRKEKKMK